MKKTLITLLALAGTVMADTLTLSSKLTYTDSANPDNSFAISAYDISINKSRKSIDDFTHNGVDCINADRLNSIPTASGKIITLNLDAMLVDGDAASLSESGAILNSISFVARDSTEKCPDDVVLTLEIGGTTYTSNVAEYAGIITDSQHGTITFTFDNGPIITSLETLNVTYVSAGDSEFGSAVFKAENSAVLSGVNNASTDWVPVAQLKMTLVPEPATATLSLLALAGLAARRRRK